MASLIGVLKYVNGSYRLATEVNLPGASDKSGPDRTLLSAIVLLIGMRLFG